MLGDAVAPVLEAHLAAGDGRFHGIRQGAARHAQFSHGIAPRPEPELSRDQRLRTGFGHLHKLRLSYGNKGVFPPPPGQESANPDYLAVDDMVKVWWNADATGPDEQGEEGRGMMMYANGGRRYLPGQMTEGSPDAFEEEGAVDYFDEVPADLRPPSYAPPADAPGA